MLSGAEVQLLALNENEKKKITLLNQQLAINEEMAMVKATRTRLIENRDLEARLNALRSHLLQNQPPFQSLQAVHYSLPMQQPLLTSTNETLPAQNIQIRESKRQSIKKESSQDKARKKQLFNFIQSYISQKGRAPLQIEMSRVMCLTQSSISLLLNALQADGLIIQLPEECGIWLVDDINKTSVEKKCLKTAKKWIWIDENEATELISNSTRKPLRFTSLSNRPLKQSTMNIENEKLKTNSLRVKNTKR